MTEFKEWDQPRTDPTGSVFVMAFLQARMGSTRLPGKALMRIQGQSVLERAIRRLRASPAVNDVAVLTTTLSEDDAIVEESRKVGAQIHRGPELDVLRRFYEAAERFRPEIIIRATADNPLIDIGSVERIVRVLRSDMLDLCIEAELPYGAAAEALTAAALAKVHVRAKEPRHREHVTLYIKEHPDEFRFGMPAAPDPLRHPRLRLTIDTREDFIFMDRLIRRFPEKNHPHPLVSYVPLALAISRERDDKALTLS